MPMARNSGGRKRRAGSVGQVTATCGACWSSARARCSALFDRITRPELGQQTAERSFASLYRLRWKIGRLRSNGIVRARKKLITDLHVPPSRRPLLLITAMNAEIRAANEAMRRRVRPVGACKAIKQADLVKVRRVRARGARPASITAAAPTARLKPRATAAITSAGPARRGRVLTRACGRPANEE